MEDFTTLLGEYLEELETVGGKAIASVKEQIDYEAERTESEIRKHAPGSLKVAFTSSKISNSTRYGYRLEFIGNHKDGTPNAKIANILNHGTSTLKPRRFITRAVRKLRGLDDRAAQRFENKIKMQ